MMMNMVMSREQRIEQYGGVYTVTTKRQHFEEPQALVADLLPQREFTLLTGPPKVGKSTFAAHLAFSIATGTPFFGREILKTGRVLYIALERADQTEQRLLTLIERSGGDGDGMIEMLVPDEVEELQYLFFNNPNSIRDDVRIVIDHLTKRGIDDIALIIVDSLENSLNGSDSQQSDAGPWCSGFKRLLDHYQAAGLVLHHDTKGSEDDPNSRTAYSGSRVFLARSGGWIRATNKGDGIRLRTVTGNYGHNWTQEVKVVDGLYDVLSPESIQPKMTQAQFVEALVRESLTDSDTTIFQHEVLASAANDSRNVWLSFGQPQMSREWRKLADSKVIVAATGVVEDGRSQAYTRGPAF